MNPVEKEWYRSSQAKRRKFFAKKKLLIEETLEDLYETWKKEAQEMNTDLLDDTIRILLCLHEEIHDPSRQSKEGAFVHLSQVLRSETDHIVERIQGTPLSSKDPDS